MSLRRLNGIMRILRQRPLVALVPCMLLALALFVYHRPRPRVHPSRSPLSQPHSEHQFDGSWSYERDRNNLLLTQGQCDQAFPHLFADIDRARDARSTNRITLQELDSIPPRPGYIRAMIYDQQVSVEFIGNQLPSNKPNILALSGFLRGLGNFFRLLGKCANPMSLGSSTSSQARARLDPAGLQRSRRLTGLSRPPPSPCPILNSPSTPTTALTRFHCGGTPVATRTRPPGLSQTLAFGHGPRSRPALRKRSC